MSGHEPITNYEAAEAAAGASTNVVGATVKALDLANVILKKIPLLGIPVAVGLVVKEAKGHWENGDRDLAFAALGIGIPEIIASPFGFAALGAGDASREFLRAAVIKAGGERYAVIDPSDVRTMGMWVRQNMTGNASAQYAVKALPHKAIQENGDYQVMEASVVFNSKVTGQTSIPAAPALFDHFSISGAQLPQQTLHTRAIADFLQNKTDISTRNQIFVEQDNEPKTFGDAPELILT